MKTIWNLLINDLDFPILDEAHYKLVNLQESNETKCDIMICGVEDFSSIKMLYNPKETFLIAALKNIDTEKEFVPEEFDAWINRYSLNELPKMLEAYNDRIENKIKLREQRELIERLWVDTSVHNANLS